MSRSQKQCVVCGRSFDCPPSAKTVTCSKACSRIHRSRAHVGVRNTWNDDSRSALRERGRPDVLDRGTRAALSSPLAGPFETNVNAKGWTLKAPDGTIHEVNNLSLFIRQHPDWFPNPRSARSALSSAASCARDETTPKSRRGRTVGQYKGWQVLYRGDKLP